MIGHEPPRPPLPGGARRQRHFGRAAERCFVSQPTLSAQIRKLEEYLGVPLVERQPRHVELTETGEKVVERARRVLQEADAIVEVAKTDRDPLAGAPQARADPDGGARTCCRTSRARCAARCRASS